MSSTTGSKSWHTPSNVERPHSVDYVPPNIQVSNKRAQVFAFEENEAVIKMIVNGRSRSLRPVSRKHRVDLDGLFERHNSDISFRHVNTTEQIADSVTWGFFLQFLSGMT